MADTSYDSWEDYGAINALGSQQCWACKGYSHVSRDCLHGEGKGKGKDNFGKGKDAYGWGKSNYDDMYKEGGMANSPSSYGPIKVYQKGDGKSRRKEPRYGKCYTCGGDHFARDCPKGGGKGGFRALEA